MALGMKRTLLFIWRMIYPLLLYQALTELVFTGYRQMTGGLSGEMVLPLTAAGAFLALIPLGHLYYQLRVSEQDRREGAGRRHLQVTMAAAAWIGISGICASLCFNNLLALLPLPEGQVREVMDLLERPSFPMQLICTVLILPLTEELVFRGLGYWRMRGEVSFAWAAFVSAVYFGLYHGNLYQGIYAWFLGLFLAFLFERTDSLPAVWIFHGAANLISVIINTMAWDKGLFEYTAVRMAIFTISGLLLAFTLYKLREDGRKSEVTIHSDSLL